jgi:hypothetical protein
MDHTDASNIPEISILFLFHTSNLFFDKTFRKCLLHELDTNQSNTPCFTPFVSRDPSLAVSL